MADLGFRFRSLPTSFDSSSPLSLPSCFNPSPHLPLLPYSLPPVPPLTLPLAFTTSFSTSHSCPPALHYVTKTPSLGLDFHLRRLGSTSHNTSRWFISYRYAPSLPLTFFKSTLAGYGFRECLYCFCLIFRPALSLSQRKITPHIYSITKKPLTSPPFYFINDLNDPRSHIHSTPSLHSAPRHPTAAPPESSFVQSSLPWKSFLVRQRYVPPPGRLRLLISFNSMAKCMNIKGVTAV